MLGSRCAGGNNKIKYKNDLSIRNLQMRNKLTIVLDEASINLIESLVNFSCIYIFKCSCGWNTNVNISVNELNKFLESNNIINCIFVASSLGVFTALTYANKYPQKIIGLVLLDPSHQNQGISALSILNSNNIPFSTELEDLRCFFSSANEMSETGATEITKIQTLHELPLLILAAGDLKFPNVINKEIKQKLIEDRHKKSSMIIILLIMILVAQVMVN